MYIQLTYGMHFIITRVGENNIGGIYFGGFNPDHQTTKFNSSSNLPAVRLFFLLQDF